MFIIYQALENEIQSHESQLLEVVKVGEDLINSNHFGADRIQERVSSTHSMWEHLIGLSKQRRKRLEDAVDYHQVIKFFFSLVAI